jgi:hypothetical protein
MAGRAVMTLSMLAAAVLAPTPAPQPQTTKPGVLYVVKTVITDAKVSIARDQYTRNGVSHLPRGAVIRYALTNRGTKPYVFEIWGERTLPIRPGGHGAILVNWNYRGRYLYRTLYRGKPTGVKGYVVVF